MRPAVSRTAFPEFDHTILEVAVDQLGGAVDSPVRRVSGRVRLDVTGHLPNLEADDRIEATCWLAKPRPQSNPGQFDFGNWLRSRGVRVVCWVNHPDAVVRLDEGSDWSIVRGASRVRASVERLVERELGSDTAPVAAALLVGSRQSLPDTVRTEFAESGTLHLLAISGLHVGILATFVWFVCRLVGCGTAVTTVVLLSVLASYAILTGGRPSVLRASVFVAVAAMGRMGLRTAAPLQILALAAALLLAWRPTDLFDPGAQLSFLAATAIAVAVELRARPSARSRSVTDLVEHGPVGRLARSGAGVLLATFGTMAIIWGFTSPLVAHRFHVVSPVGLLVNVFLVPAIVPIMWLGYSFVVVGMTFGFGTSFLAAGFDASLRALLRVVEWAGDWQIGHRYLSGPPSWWIIGFYAGVAALVVVSRRHRWPTRIAAVLVFWTIAGLTATTRTEPGDLRCTFLSVGHGSAVLLELPNGKTLLYDGGSLTSPEYADRVVRSALWNGGRSRLDAIVASHADVDHFNAIPDILEAIPVDTLLVSRPFLDFEQGFVTELCDVATNRGATIRLVHAGDEIVLDDEASIDVIHPRSDGDYDSDNAASLILLVTYRGRRILLTGDIENDGLEELLSGPSIDVDVLASPHHGSARANPPALADWARPEFVVVSAGTRTRLDAVEEAFPSAEVLATFREGAIIVVVTDEGDLSCDPFRSRESEHEAIEEY